MGVDSYDIADIHSAVPVNVTYLMKLHIQSKVL